MADASFPPLKREPLLEEELPSANPAVHVIKGARIKFAPGQPTGLHRHPVSTVGVVTAGSFNFQPEGRPARLLRTGDSFSSRPVTQFSTSTTRRQAKPPKSSVSTTQIRRSARRSRCSKEAWLVSWGKNNCSPLRRVARGRSIDRHPESSLRGAKRRSNPGDRRAAVAALDCFASLAMTVASRSDRADASRSQNRSRRGIAT